MIRVRRAEWETDGNELRLVRREVFVVEQNVPEHLELDGRDAHCVHAIAFDEKNRPIGVARMDARGHIGRVAVLAPRRGAGAGSRLIEFLVALAAAEGLDQVDLNSQTRAAGFYQRLGFTPAGDEFEEAGIPHIRMERKL